MRSLFLNRIAFFLLGGAIFFAGYWVSDKLKDTEDSKDNHFENLYVEKSIYIGGFDKYPAMIVISAEPVSTQDAGISIMHKDRSDASLSLDHEGYASLSLRGAGDAANSPSISMESGKKKSEVFVSGLQYTNYFRSDSADFTRVKSGMRK